MCSFLFVGCGFVECQRNYENYPDNKNVDRQPNAKPYRCLGSTEQYDCIFQNVYIDYLKDVEHFGHIDPSLNNKTKLKFENSALSVLPKGLVDTFADVELLNLEGLQISSIEPRALLQGRKIKELYLGYNKISQLDVGVFDSLTSLEILNLNKNNISSVPMGLFQNARNLSVLLLENNNLQEIGDRTFQHNTNLDSIKVASNKLTHFDLSRIPHLMDANVTFNLLQTLSVGGKIEIVDASHNNISEVVGKSSVMKQMFLSNNKLNNASWVQNFVALEELDLSFNLFEDISYNDFKKLTKITKLLLNNNRLFTFDFVSFTKPSNLPLIINSLKILDLSHNLLLYVVKNQEQFEKLDELYLDHNSIVTLKLGTKSQIKRLSLSHNDWDCKNLRELLPRLSNTVLVDANSQTACKNGYTNQDGICCLENDMPYLDRLMRHIAELSLAEKATRANGCGASKAMLDLAKNMTSRFKFINPSGPSALENEVRQLSRNYNVLNRQRIAQDQKVSEVIVKVDELGRLYRVTKLGLVQPSINLKSVFEHLKQREQFKVNETIARNDNTKNKMEEKSSLETVREQLKDSIVLIKSRQRELSKKVKPLEIELKKLESALNNNPRAQKNAK